MFDELKKSISAILYERTTSPLFGSFVVSWSVWNWKILYLTVFISEDRLPTHKIDYILQNYWNWVHLFWLPLFSTLILLTIVPFFSNGAYWLSILFDDWKVRKKRIVENSQQLTLAQSIKIKSEALESEKRFLEVLQDKELEIEQLKRLVQETKDTQTIQTTVVAEKISDNVDQLVEKIMNNKELLQSYETIIHAIQKSYPLVNQPISSLMISFFESN